MKNHIAGWKAQTEYGAEYVHDGEKWGLNFYATDDADAAAKLESIKASLVLLGRVNERIPLEDPPPA